MTRPGMVRKHLTDSLGRRTSRWVREEPSGRPPASASALPPTPVEASRGSVERTAAGRAYDRVLLADVAVGERLLIPFSREEVPGQVDAGIGWMTLLEHESDGYARVSKRGTEYLVTPGSSVVRELDDDGVPTRDPEAG